MADKQHQHMLIFQLPRFPDQSSFPIVKIAPDYGASLRSNLANQAAFDYLAKE
jgi:hypothetical protein